MNIHIVFTTDNNYLPYLSVAIQSIYEHSNNNYNYNLYIFHGKLSISNQEILMKNIPENFNTEFVNVSEKFANKKLFYGNASIEAYYRLYIPYYFTNIEKVLYLDCDLICVEDVSILYNTNLENNCIGAVKGVSEIGGFLNSKKHYWNQILKLDNPLNYFNSGVMLINNNSFRNKISFEDLCSYAETQSWPCFDQDVLNQLFQNDIMFISNDWNFVKHHNSVYAPDELLKDYYKSEKNPKIIHYASGYKPWSKKNYMPFSYEFWKYATRSNFSNTIIEHMNKNYTSFSNENIDVYTLPIISIFKIVYQRIIKKICKSF
jgi:lipopolysaccharide biosynthesis glycosyltransferase